MHRRHVLHGGTGLLLSSSLGLSIAQTPAPAPAASPINLEELLRPARVSAVDLSPSGKYLAALVPVGGRRNLAILEIGQGDFRAITSFKEEDVGGFAWVSEDRLVFWMGLNLQLGLGAQRLGQGLLAINRDGTEPRIIASPNPNLENARNFVFRTTWFGGTVANLTGEFGSFDVLGFTNDRNATYPDVVRIDTRTGRRTLLTDRKPGDAIFWIADRMVQVRAAVTTEDENRRNSLYWRATGDSPWVLQASWPTYSGKEVTPVGFEADGTLLVLADHQGRMALWRWDTGKRTLAERMVAHKDYDLTPGSLRWDAETGDLAGVSIEAERPMHVWFDESLQALQDALDKAQPTTTNFLARSSTKGRVLVTSRSDRNATRWQLYDPASKRVDTLASAAPWLRPEQFFERRFVRYRARDGRSIPAYLTLPAPRRDGRKPALVVLVHGGPYVRGETWRFDRDAQFLATRGYAVLQPDFRGSTGYGHDHYAAGLRQWGLTMQDDLNDGALWAVAEGHADRSRLVIAGASYGGYAVMMGLARDPDFWCCGVNWVGVTDLELLTRATWSDTAQWGGAEHFFSVHIGNAKDDAERFAQTSPLRQAGRIRKPVLMVYGARDVRVPIEHATRIEAEMKAKNLPVELVVYNDEGHGFLRQANQLDFYGRFERFLATHAS
ncbi:MAG: alpha/beta hydrolase family protein [Betaproteobacteria bacterium]|jgi:dipeptidyl aminopeptidase/acylaminoacyl peptidase